MHVCVYFLYYCFFLGGDASTNICFLCMEVIVGGNWQNMENGSIKNMCSFTSDLTCNTTDTHTCIICYISIFATSANQ